MAGIKKKLKAATILESMVAMVIIVICLGVGTMIFVNVLNNDKDRRSLKATLLLNKKSNAIHTEKRFIDGEEIMEGLVLKKIFTKYNQADNLFQMTLQLLDKNGKLIQEKKRADLNRMKKLKAFTLMELIIGMIIGSIVVGFCYTGYRMIFRQYLDYKKTKMQVNEVMLFNTVLTQDFSRSLFIEYKDNRLELIVDSLKIGYGFADAFILRTEKEVSDTFHFEPQNIVAVFLDEEENNVVRDFSFNAVILGEQEEFRFTKKYSAEFLMRYDKKQDDGN